MRTVEEALATILDHVSSSEVIRKALPECRNETLAENLITPHDSPPFDKSMMDGFAVLASEQPTTGSNTLSVLETITAGTVPSKSVTAATASRIMTGAPIPVGANCVAPIERVDFDDAHPDTVTISTDDIIAERHILRQGNVTRAGELLMPAGTIIEPQHIAVLAEFGIARVPIHRRPTVAVLATGDELLPIDQPLTPGRIRNSNEPMLVSQIARAGATPMPLGVAKDNRDELQTRIQQGLEGDFLLLSGGVSAGTMDLVPSELAAAGVKQIFHKIQMKPGKPLWFGKLTTADHTCLVFGLPGNPVSSMICFEVFVRTAIRAFCGHPTPHPHRVTATLTEDITVRGDRQTYFPAKLTIHDSGITATPVRWGGSADLRSTADANGMCILDPQPNPYSDGEQVEGIFW